MSKLLPVGAYVRVTDLGEDARPSYVAIVRGYDMGHTKYEVGRRFGGWGRWLFGAGNDWTFPSWCVEITEAEATALPTEAEYARARGEF